MSKYKYRFLIGSSILIFMGSLMKLEHVGNAQPTLIAGILNFIAFLVFYVKDMQKKLG
ncbi:MAG: hypothetical protein JNM41_08585 [Flavipsychrobacter sp.]|nr:hypothetical protein [Flavipsychrobacter sp.]